MLLNVGSKGGGNLENLFCFLRQIGAKNAWVTTEINRDELNFEPNRKPGDIDILLIPVNNGLKEFNKSLAIEVKVAIPTIKNQSRNSNSLGTTQALGLSSDGFPFVGLYHIVMNEPLTEEMFKELNPEYTSSNFYIDSTANIGITNQYERIIKRNLPEHIGVNVQSLNKHNGDRFMIWRNLDYEEYGQISLNPLLSNQTIKEIENHSQKYPEKYVYY